MNAAQHTPGPWAVDGQMVVAPNSPRRRWGEQQQFDGPFIVTQCGLYTGAVNQAEAEANARRIVQCVNAHDELVAALRDFMLASSPGVKAAQWRALAAQAARKGRAALAKLDGVA